MSQPDLSDVKAQLDAAEARLRRAAAHLSIVMLQRPDEDAVKGILRRYHRGLLHARQGQEAQLARAVDASDTAYLLGYERGLLEVEREEAGRVSGFMTLPEESAHRVAASLEPTYIERVSAAGREGPLEPAGRLVIDGIAQDVFTFEQLQTLLARSSG